MSTGDGMKRNGIDRFLDVPLAQIVIVPGALSMIGFLCAGDKPAWRAAGATAIVIVCGLAYAAIQYGRLRRFGTLPRESSQPISAQFEAGVVSASLYPLDATTGRIDTSGLGTAPLDGSHESEERLKLWPEAIAGRLCTVGELKKLAVIQTSHPRSMASDIRSWCAFMKIECRLFPIPAGDDADIESIIHVARDAVQWSAQEVGFDKVLVDITGGSAVLSSGLFVAASENDTTIAYQKPQEPGSYSLMTVPYPAVDNKGGSE